MALDFFGGILANAKAFSQFRVHCKFVGCEMDSTCLGCNSGPGKDTSEAGLNLGI